MQTFLNIVLISLPEELFHVLFTILILKQHSCLERNGANILKLVLTAVPAAVLSNVLMDRADMNYFLCQSFCFAIIFLTGIMVYRIRPGKDIVMGALGLGISFFLSMLFRSIYFIFVVYGTDIELSVFKEFSLLTFMGSLIDRGCQIALICIMMLKKKRYVRESFFSIIYKNRTMAIISLIVVLTDLLYIYIACDLVLFRKGLLVLGISEQMLAVFIILIFPVINLSSIYGIVVYSSNKCSDTRIYIQQESRVLRMLVQMLLKQQKYEDIDGHIHSFEKNVSKLK
jgi:hypothetical protein